ncbi:MAG: DUF2206 domain-containing protein [Patescibacteria group bacterium]|mgnify:CR=1 FL=1
MNLRRLFPSLTRPLSVYLLAGLVLVNTVAIFHADLFYICAFFSFFYIITTPGFLLLPLLTKRKLPAPLGLTFSVALSVLILMLVGLGLNTVLPLLGMHEPLSTLPLILAFDAVVYVLLVLNYETQKDSSFELHDFDAFNWSIVFLAALLPVGAFFGSALLNNGGSNVLTMLVLALVFVLIPTVLFSRRIKSSAPPIVLYLVALAFLLMNSMRGWFITGHDILLEYHVFVLTNDAHLWNMAFYRDPYNACLSLTILPTYLQNLLHVGNAYIFKFFFQFIGALAVVPLYYLARQYVSEKIAFLVGFLFISFPTYMVDMAFLNRQGMAFVFFGSMLFTLLTVEYFSGRVRTFLLFAFGTGMILSHYSTSYIAVPLLLSAYAINRVLRFLVRAKGPTLLTKLTAGLGNREMYEKPILLTLPFVLGLLVIMLVWSSLITKTSKGLFNTVEQIATTITHPFSTDGFTGPAKYNLFQAKKATPEELFSKFLEDGIKKNEVVKYESVFYPLSITQKYPAIPVAEHSAPLTVFGEKIQKILHINLPDFFGFIKQTYAKFIQIFLLIGLIGLSLGYVFKKHVLQNVPIEYIALSISGIGVMFGQTILPGSAIDYGLLRLFQQNLIFLALPIILGMLWIGSLVARNHKGQLLLVGSFSLVFFAVLSGFIPQLTGGGRLSLSLNNSGLYYDSYYTHAHEIAATKWTAASVDRDLPVQAAHFSDIKMIAYGYVAPFIELLPETIKRKSYEYLNYQNTKTHDIIEIIGGDVIYYRFPIEFLDDYKDLIYDNGGSKMYR